MKVKLNKIASVTYRLDLTGEVEISRLVQSETGNVLVVRALEEKRVYDVMELTTGRMAHVGKGDVLVGALGQRDALRGFVGRVPGSVSVGDTLHLLNLGGVLGEVISENKDVGHPLRVEVLGADGALAWEQVISTAHAKGLLVIGDVKRNDIASTAQAYATAFLEGSDDDICFEPRDDS